MCGGRIKKCKKSGVSFREEMQNTVDIGGVADMAEFEFKIKIFLDAFNLQGKGWTIREMINNGTNAG